MDFKQILYFVTIVEEGNISKAAKKLHIAQPALSMQLKSLEEYLGVILLERGSRNVKLTDAGYVFYKRSVKILKMVDTSVSEIDDLKNGNEGTIRLGQTSSSCTYVVDKVKSNFSKNYPNVKYELFEGNTYEILELVEEGVIDLGIVRTPFDPGKLNYRYLREEPMVAVMNNEIYANFNNDEINLKELEKYPLIIYRRYEELIMNCFKKLSIEPKIICLNDDSRTTLLWAEKGLGIGIIPESTVRDKEDYYKYYKISDNELKTNIAVIWAKDKYISQVVKKFMELI